MYDLLDYIDHVQESVIDAGTDVMMSMADVYTKSAMILENAEDVSSFSIFMEAGEGEGEATATDAQAAEPEAPASSGSSSDKKKKEVQVRKKNFFVKALRFIKRLWQQILTMISSRMLSQSIKKVEKYVKSDKCPDRLQVKYSEKQYEAMQFIYRDLERTTDDNGINHFSYKSEDWANNDKEFKKKKAEDLKSAALSSTQLAKSLEQYMKMSAGKSMRSGGMRKDALLEILDSAKKIIADLTQIAKRINKIIDNSDITRSDINGIDFDAYNKDSDGGFSDLDDVVKTLNNASTITFKGIRSICSDIRDICDSVITDNETARKKKEADEEREKKRKEKADNATPAGAPLRPTGSKTEPLRPAGSGTKPLKGVRKDQKGNYAYT